MDKNQSKCNDFFRKIINKNMRKKIKNKEFTLISSNCNGGYIYHDLGLKFLSPFINLYMYPKDFIKYLKNIEHYRNAELAFIHEDGKKYPVGMLDDLKIEFMHYENEEVAREKWEERTKRMNLDNLFVLFTDRDGCTYEDLKEFDSLNIKNKIVFTHKEYPELKSAYHIKGFENDKEVGICCHFRNKYSGKRYMDDFNYVKWLNG